MTTLGQRIARLFVVAGLVGISMLVVTVVGTAHSAAAEVPYDDQDSTGGITLCDQGLNPVTQGSIDDAPFVWRAVGSERPPAPYDDEHRKAFLYAFQPQEGVAPGLWPGELLTAASTYTNPDHPMAQATLIDFPLSVFISRFPPRWDGFLQLRMYYSTVGASSSTDYVSADIQVTGQEWTLVAGGDAPCDSGEARSDEEMLPNFKKSVKAVQAKAERQEQQADPSQSPDPSSQPDASKTEDPKVAGVAGASGSSSGGLGLPLLVVAAVAIGMGAIGVAAWRMRGS